MSEIFVWPEHLKHLEEWGLTMAEWDTLIEMDELWRNPSNATVRKRNAVKFRPRSNAERCKQALWARLCLIDVNWRKQLKCPLWFFSGSIGVCSGPHDQIFATQTEVDMLAMASLWCDFDYIDPVVDLIFPMEKAEWLKMPIDNRQFTPPLRVPSLKWIQRLTMSAEFAARVDRVVSIVSPEAYIANDQDTGTDIINRYRERILNPMTTNVDVIGLTRELTRREAKRLREFGY